MADSGLAGGGGVTLVERVAAQIEARFSADSSGHDWHHINRVRHLARRMAGQERADPEVAELAALVHDIADWKFHAGGDTIMPRQAELLLTQEGAPRQVVEAVVRYRGDDLLEGGRRRQPASSSL